MCVFLANVLLHLKIWVVVEAVEYVVEILCRCHFPFSFLEKSNSRLTGINCVSSLINNNNNDNNINRDDNSGEAKVY